MPRSQSSAKRQRRNEDRRSNRSERYDGNEAKKNARPRKKQKGSQEALDETGMDNNPNWYFSDRMLAEQVSQLSFQQIAGLETKNRDNTNLPVANIMRILLNPAPGVQGSSHFRPGQKSAINQAGFKLYSLLSAYTGRSSVYGPQDLSIMILYMGEIISLVEYLRRVFGCMFVWSERDRSYPKQIISAMGIDPDDLMSNYSDHRTRFNSIVQRINQVPIPANIAYFDKCASLYEKIYKDSPSAMSALIFMAPYTTWELDETSDPRGTVLKSHEWMFQPTGAPSSMTKMGTFLVDLEARVQDLMSSSTFNVVYTDLLNLATKMSVPFWKFDYLSEGYVVTPEYNENFLLQLHNMTAIWRPGVAAEATVGTQTITPFNDVISDPNNNQLLYNPGWIVGNKAVPQSVFCDLNTDVPTVETRVEALRFTSAAGYGWYNDGTNDFQTDMAVPDHYVVAIHTYTPSGVLSTWSLQFGLDIANYSANDLLTFVQNASYWSHVDWAPIIYDVVNWTTLADGTKLYSTDAHACIGDLNFWTSVDSEWIRKVTDFVGVDLYSIRS